MIDKEEIKETYLELTPIKAGEESPLVGDENGIVEFGEVKLTNLPIDIYSKASLEYRDSMEPTLGTEVVQQLLKNTGHECGFHTFRSIKDSEFFQERIAHRFDNDEDKLRALAVAMGAFGMGETRIVRADEEEVVVRSYKSPEAVYYLEHRDEESDSAVCSMQAGIIGSLPNVVFREGKEVYEEEPSKFHPESYMAKETKCKAKGDPYCEFVVRKEFNFDNDQEPPEKYR